MSLGNENEVLTTQGDLVYYGGNGPARLPVGEEGQVLRVSATGEPEWVSLGAVDQVYYVAPHGTDQAAPISGLTIDKPWKTIRYATEQIEQGPRNPKAKRLLELNRVFIQREVTEWIDYQIANATGGSIWENFDYDEYKCERDVGFIVDRLIDDLGHGGNLKTLSAALTYINALSEADLFATASDENGTGLYTKIATEADNDVAAFTQMLTIIEDVLAQQAPAVNYQVLNGDNSTSIVSQAFDSNIVAVEPGAMTAITGLVGIVTTALTDGNANNLPARYTPANMLNVKAGNYFETLPIIVPANLAVQGAETRSVHVSPAPSLIDIADSEFSVASLARLEEVVSSVIVGSTVTETSGNTESQDQSWPYATSNEVDNAAQLVRVMKYNIDFRLGTTHSFVTTEPTDYNTTYLTGYGDAKTLVFENKEFFKQQVKAFINTTYPTLNYSRTSCLRDVGYIVDALVYDLTYGGNSQSVQAGLAYYEGVGSSFIVDSTETAATLASYNYLKTMVQDAIDNVAITVTQNVATQFTDGALVNGANASVFLGNNIDEMIDIITNGPTAATLTDPSTAWVSGALTTAYSTLNSAVSTIQSNTISYINTTYPAFVGSYNETKCSRDVGIILKAVGYDFMFNANHQTLKAAYSYLRATAGEVFSLGQKTITRAALEYVRTQAIANVGAEATAIARINSLMQALDDIIYSGSNEGSVCSSNERTVDYAVLQLERNRAFIVAEVIAWMNFTYSNDYVTATCERDINKMIDALKFDLKYPGNYKSLLVARYYSNAVIGNLEEDMFYMRNSTGVRNMTLEGLTGDLTPENAYGTRRVTAGAYVSLDPGWGPDDFRTWIINRSPYIQNVATFGYAAIGQKIDGALHNGGYDSMVSNDFTQLISDGIGAWVTNNGRAELVSVFTYYSHIGYLAEAGGRIRGTNGNNSYGDFGSVAEGVDSTEVPNTAIVDNKYQFKATVGTVVTDSAQEVYNFEFDNAGSEYTEATWIVSGAGLGAETEADEFRDGAVFQVRLLDNVDDSTSAPEASGNFGGFGYISNSNTAQGGTTTQITIAATDDELSTAYIGMKIMLTGSTGAGQFGIIDTYNAGTKIATVVKESTGAAGWDHVIPGTTISAPDASTTYTIEPRISFTGPSYSSSATTLPSQLWSDARYAELYKTYEGISGTASEDGVGATFNVVRKGTKYVVELNAAGTGYQRLETITILGTSLDGATTANDLVITVTSINSVTGAITEFDIAGIGAGGKFIAIARSTRDVSVTSDGATWSTLTDALPTSSTWYALASGKITAPVTAGDFVIGETYTIVDVGTNTPWTAIGAADGFIGTTFIATGIGAGDGTAVPVVSSIVAVGADVAAYSLDGGATWTASTIGTGNWQSIAYGDGKWVAITSDSVNTMYSEDGGATWTAGGDLPTADAWQGIAYGAGKWVAVSALGSGVVAAYTADVTANWTQSTLPADRTWLGVTYGNNRFVAVASNASNTTAAYSIDGGATWAASTVPAASYIGVGYGQGVFLAVSSTTQAASSTDGINWTSRTTSTASAAGFARPAFGNPSNTGVWVAIHRGVASAGTVGTKIALGATTKARAFVSQEKIFAIRITEPGSGYTVAPTITITDPNNIFEAPTQVRIGNGALANPSFKDRGAGYVSAAAEIDAGNGYADFYQNGQYIAVRQLTQRPVPGSNIVFGHLPDQTFKLVNVLSLTGEEDGSYAAFFQISPDMKAFSPAPHGTTVTTRIRYSQVRLTGHDFLDIGVGNFADTNYPGTPVQDAIQANETLENNGGRVFFTSTDQDGNFRVGDLFTIEQSTGVATLNADAFNIAGLQELSLGEVTLGGGSASITEFSTDPFFTANSDNIVPTQRAIKAYISSQIGGGGASLNVNSVTAGSIYIASNQITTTTGGLIQIKAKFNFQGGVTGLPVAWNYFLT